MVSKVYTIEFGDCDSVLFIIVSHYCDGLNSARVITACGNHGSAADIGNSRESFHDALDGWYDHATECSIDDGPLVSTRDALQRIADVLFE